MIAITKRDIVWNYAGSIVSICMNVLILPAVLMMLSSEELGLWYVFGSAGALVHLMDFGFAPAITRNVSYAWSGVKTLLVEGVAECQNENGPNFNLVGDLFFASRKIYTAISLTALALLLTLGSVFIKSLMRQESSTMGLVAWAIYSLAVFVNLFFSYWSSMLRGIGKIMETNQAILISRILYMVSAVAGLSVGGGLIWLSISYLLSGVILRVLSARFTKKALGKNGGLLRGRRQNAIDCFHIIWPNAMKQGFVTVGGWLITRGNTLLCSTFLGLEVTARYGLSLQLFQMVGGIASLLFGSYAPELASLKTAQKTDRYIRIFSRAISAQWLVSFLGITGVIVFGPPVLRFIGSNSELLPVGVLLMLGVVLFLEWNHSTFATLITLSNKVPFVKASILSGIAIFVLALLSVKLTGLGIAALILSQGLVQLAYNNWYWPRFVMKENNISIYGVVVSSIADFASVLTRIPAEIRQKRENISARKDLL